MIALLVAVATFTGGMLGTLVVETARARLNRRARAEQ